MENMMTAQEKETLIKQLEEDIKYVDNNLMCISTGIIQEIGKLEKLKNGINIYQIEGLKIDRKNNTAQIFDLETFERQLTRKTVETAEAIKTKQDFISFLSSEHSRIKAIKTELEAKLAKAKSVRVKKDTKPSILKNKTSAGIQLGFEITKK